jgi:hypothetical protein
MSREDNSRTTRPMCRACMLHTGMGWRVNCTYLHVSQIVMRGPVLVDKGRGESDPVPHIPQQPLRNVTAPDVAHSAMDL